MYSGIAHLINIQQKLAGLHTEKIQYAKQSTEIFSLFSVLTKCLFFKNRPFVRTESVFI